MDGQCRSHRSIRTHLKALETAITDPGGVATSLYQEGLIDNLAWQRADIASAAVPRRACAARVTFCHSVRLLPRFLPLRATRRPKSDTNGLSATVA